MTHQFFGDLKATVGRLKTKHNIDYDKCKTEVLLDGYCDAVDSNNEDDKSLFMAGLLLRFWYLCVRLKAKSPGHGTDTEEFAMWLYEGIEYACKYRAWRNPEKKVNGTQAVCRCVETIRLQHHYDSNLDKHKANFNTMSLEDPVNQGDDRTTFLDMLEGEEYAEKAYQGDENDAARELIQVYVQQNKLVEAVILDIIAFNDVEHTVSNTVKTIMEDGSTKKVTEKYSEFWPFKCVQLLHQLPEDYVDYFTKNYKTKPLDVDAVVNVLSTVNNTKLYKYLRKTLANAKIVLAKLNKD